METKFHLVKSIFVCFPLGMESLLPFACRGTKLVLGKKKRLVALKLISAAGYKYPRLCTYFPGNPDRFS